MCNSSNSLSHHSDKNLVTIKSVVVFSILFLKDALSHSDRYLPANIYGLCSYVIQVQQFQQFTTVYNSFNKISRFTVKKLFNLMNGDKRYEIQYKFFLENIQCKLAMYSTFSHKLIFATCVKLCR